MQIFLPEKPSIGRPTLFWMTFLDDVSVINFRLASKGVDVPGPCSVYLWSPGAHDSGIHRSLTEIT